MEERRNAHIIFVSLNGRDCSEDLGVERIILK
jgi:hypothetical protein